MNILNKYGRLHMLHSSSKGALRRATRPIQFGMVGVSGIVVNTVVLWLLAQVGRAPVLLASAVATEISILSNFLLNDRWTFRKAESERGSFARLLRFNGVALGGMLITLAVLALLTHATHMPLLVANVAAIGTATFWNYFVNSMWTWGKSSPLSHKEPAKKL